MCKRDIMPGLYMLVWEPGAAFKLNGSESLKLTFNRLIVYMFIRVA